MLGILDTSNCVEIVTPLYNKEKVQSFPVLTKEREAWLPFSYVQKNLDYLSLTLASDHEICIHRGSVNWMSITLNFLETIELHAVFSENQMT